MMKRKVFLRISTFFFALALTVGPWGRSVAQVADAGNVTVNFRDVDILTVLHYLSEVSGVDIVPAPGVEGAVTMRLRNQPWEVALDIVTRNNGYVHSREGNIIRVIPQDQVHQDPLVLEVIPLNHLIREIELQKGGRQDDIAVEAREESIERLMSSIGSMLNRGRGETATFIPSINSIIISAIPSKIDLIKGLVEKVDRKTPQIMLSAKIIEIGLDEEERFGVDWNAVISAAGARRPITFPFTPEGLLPFLPSGQRMFYPDTGYPQDESDLYLIRRTNIFPTLMSTTYAPEEAPMGVEDGAFSFGTLDFSTFTATLELLERRGNAEVLSAPRITTLNNRKATIKVVEKIMFQRAVEAVETTRAVVVQFESEDEAREVGVILTVVPHVNSDGDIAVNLFPEVSTNAGFTPITVGETDTTIALTFNSRKANTTVRVRDGETIFIGGLIRENKSVRTSKFPILGDVFGRVPVLGSLFKYERDTLSRSEIVFFITVDLLKDGMDSLEKTRTYPRLGQYLDPGYGTLQPRFTLETEEMVETTETIEIELPGDVVPDRRGE